MNNFIPLAKDLKKPLVKGWQKDPYTLIIPEGESRGLVCGILSNNLEVIDVDVKNDPFGTIAQDYIRSIPKKILKKLVIQKTRNKGIHLIYRCEDIEGNQQLAKHIDGKVIIETRGEGGYINVVPSPGYKLGQGDLDNIPEITPDERDILLTLAAQLSRVAPRSGNPNGNLPALKNNSVGGGLRVSSVESDMVHLRRVHEGAEKILLRDDLQELGASRDSWFNHFLAPLASSARERPGIEPQLKEIFDLICEQLPGDKSDNDSTWADIISRSPPDGKGITIGSFLALVPEDPIEVAETPEDLPDLFHALHTNYTFERNELTGEIEKNRIEVTDTMINTIFVQIGGKTPIAKIKAFIDTDFLPSYNPIMDIINRYPEGFIGTIDKYASGVETEQDFPKYFKKWYVNMVKMALSNRAINNPLMLCLLGGQNIGKSELFRRLLPEELRPFYSEYGIKPHDPDFKKQMTSNLVVMDDEMDGYGPKDMDGLKSALTATSFDYRDLYKNKTRSVKRRASLCGTGNHLEVLNDTTGNRRIIPIEVTKIDFEILDSIDRGAMIAEAYWLINEGFDTLLNQEEITHLNNGESEKFTRLKPEQEMALKHFEPLEAEEPGCLILIATEFRKILNKLSGDNAYTPRFKSHMEAVGFNQLQTRVDGRKGRYYFMKTIIEDKKHSNGYYEQLLDV